MREGITIRQIGSGASTILYDVSTPLETQLQNAKSLALASNSGAGAEIQISVWENLFVHRYIINPATHTITKRSR